MVSSQILRLLDRNNQGFYDHCNANLVQHWIISNASPYNRQATIYAMLILAKLPPQASKKIPSVNLHNNNSMQSLLQIVVFNPSIIPDSLLITMAKSCCTDHVIWITAFALMQGKNNIVVETFAQNCSNYNFVLAVCLSNNISWLLNPFLQMTNATKLTNDAKYCIDQFYAQMMPCMTQVQPFLPNSLDFAIEVNNQIFWCKRNVLLEFCPLLYLAASQASISSKFPIAVIEACLVWIHSNSRELGCSHVVTLVLDNPADPGTGPALDSKNAFDSMEEMVCRRVKKIAPSNTIVIAQSHLCQLMHFVDKYDIKTLARALECMLCQNLDNIVVMDQLYMTCKVLLNKPQALMLNMMARALRNKCFSSNLFTDAVRKIVMME